LRLERAFGSHRRQDIQGKLAFEARKRKVGTWCRLGAEQSRCPCCESPGRRVDRKRYMAYDRLHH
jgi:hypothetical protein